MVGQEGYGLVFTHHPLRSRGAELFGPWDPSCRGVRRRSKRPVHGRCEVDLLSLPSGGRSTLPVTPLGRRVCRDHAMGDEVEEADRSTLPVGYPR